MHDLVSFNYQISRASETNLSAISSATFYGKGVFTTVAIYNCKPFLWKKHWRRVCENTSRLRIDLAEFSEANVHDSLSKLIAENNVIDGRSRLTFFDESAKGIWQIENNKKTSLLITTTDFRQVEKLSLTVSPYRINSTSPLANIKSCNYLENLLTLAEAKKRGFDEAIRLNEKGEIASACMANIFWLKDEKIYTPSLQTGCLAGTTREFLLENYAVFEVEESPEKLKEAEGIFLTSAGIGVREVENFNSKTFVNSVRFTKLEESFKNQVRNYTEIE